MGVEVELLYREGRGHLSFLVHVERGEHWHSAIVFQDFASGLVLQITSLVSRLASLVAEVALAVLEHDNVASVVPVQLSEYVVDIESSALSVGGHLDWVLGLVEVLQRILAHDDLSLLAIVFFLELLLTNLADKVSLRGEDVLLFM